jgi:GT2 family glycosyltransferase
MRHPKVAVIVLNWNGLEDTRACVASLAAQTYRPAQIYVVDNASSDGSAEALAREFPQFTHIRNAQNLGFTQANNAAMARALAEDADYVLLLNNDTEAAPDFLCWLVAAAEADPQAGMVGPKIYFYDRPGEIWYAGGRVDFGRLHPFIHVGEGEPDAGQRDAPGRTGFVTGCCLLVRAEVIRQTGMLDPSYGYYCEDVDWSLRARRAGWRLLYEPRARVWHKINRSMRRGNVQQVYYTYRNIPLVARRHLGVVRALPILLRVIKWAVLHPAGESKAALLEAMRDVVIGRKGLVAAPGASPSARALARVLCLPVRIYWWFNARVAHRGREAPTVL